MRSKETATIEKKSFQSNREGATTDVVFKGTLELLLEEEGGHKISHLFCFFMAA